MRKVFRWFTALIPPWAIGMALVLYGFFEGYFLFISHMEPTRDELAGSLAARYVYVLAIVVAYAFYRATVFHPFWNERYRNWLSATPWRWHLPLPVGPLHLVFQDVVVLLIAIVMCHGMADSHLMMLPITFLIVYLMPFCASFIVVKMPISAWILAAGVGAVIWLCSISQLAALGAAVACYAFLYALLPALFKLFPWGHLKLPNLRNIDPTQGKLGWPFDVLAPAFVPLPPLWESIVGPLVAGWWAFAILSNTPTEARPLLGRGFSWLMLAALIFVWPHHLGVLSHRPPINFIGRLLTLRWIIPRYDLIVLLPVLLALITCFVLRGYLLNFLVPLIVEPIVASTLILILSLFFRIRDHWRLTCPARLTPGGYPLKEFEHL